MPHDETSKFIENIPAIRGSIEKGAPDTRRLDGFVCSEKGKQDIPNRPALLKEVQSLNTEIIDFYSDALFRLNKEAFLAIPQGEFQTFAENPTLNRKQFPEHKTFPENLYQMTVLFNKVSHYVITRILSSDTDYERTLEFERWINIANRCYETGNLLGVFQILSAFSSAEIYRLAITKESISKEHQDIYSKLQKVISKEDNSATYRKEILTKQAIIPYLGIVQTDLTFTHDQDIEKEEVRKSAANKIFKELEAQQKAIKEIPSKTTDLKILSAQLEQTHTKYDADTQYQRSLQLEPRELEQSEIDRRILKDSAFFMYPVTEKELLDSLKEALKIKNKRITYKTIDGHPSFIPSNPLFQHHRGFLQKDRLTIETIFDLINNQIQAGVIDEDLLHLINANKWIKEICDETPMLKARLESMNVLVCKQRDEEHAKKTIKIENPNITQIQDLEKKINEAFQLKETHAEDWESSKDDKYNFARHLCSEGNSAFTGTNHSLMIQEFNEHSYHNTKTEDFIERANALMNTAISRVYKDDRLVDTGHLITWLMEQHKEVQDTLYEECNIKTTDDDETIYQKIKKAQPLLRQFLVDIVYATDPDLQGKNKVTQAALDKFFTEESEWIAETGRPNLIHTYPIFDEKTGNSITRVSTQQTMGKRTNPSTIRNRPELTNAAKTSCGKRDEKGKYIIDFFAYRHCSYTPISIEKEDIERHYDTTIEGHYDITIGRHHGTTQSVQQVMADMAEQKVMHMTPEERKAIRESQPLELSLSTMMLLSPSWLLDGGKTDENRQVNESQMALMIFNNRTVPIKINIAGEEKEIHVKLNVTTMNAPTNSKATEFLSYTKNVINCPGFSKYSDNIMAYLQNNYVCRLDKANESTNDRIAKINQLTQNILETYQHDPALKKAKAEVSDLEKSLQLDRKYEQLHEYQKAYIKTSEEKRPSLESTYKTLYNQIREDEKQLAEAYGNVLSIRNDIRTRKKAVQLDELYKKIIAFLKDPNNKELLETEDGKKLQNLYTILQLFLDAEKIYFNKQQFTFEYAHDLQARYIISNYLIGRNVEFFCKSGEDRTGRLNNYIEEFFAFKDLYNAFPSIYEQADIESLSVIAPKVHEYSVTREIAHWNSPGARGLQQDVDESTMGIRIHHRLRVNKHVPVKSDRTLAKLAKELLYIDKKGTFTPKERFGQVTQEVTKSGYSDFIEWASDRYTKLKNNVYLGLINTPEYIESLEENRRKLKRAYKTFDNLLKQTERQASLQKYHDELEADRKKPELKLEESYDDTPLITKIELLEDQQRILNKLQKQYKQYNITQQLTQQLTFLKEIATQLTLQMSTLVDISKSIPIEDNEKLKEAQDTYRIQLVMLSQTLSDRLEKKIGKQETKDEQSILQRITALFSPSKSLETTPDIATDKMTLSKQKENFMLQLDETNNIIAILTEIQIPEEFPDEGIVKQQRDHLASLFNDAIQRQRELRRTIGKLNEKLRSAYKIIEDTQPLHHTIIFKQTPRAYYEYDLTLKNAEPTDEIIQVDDLPLSDRQSDIPPETTNIDSTQIKKTHREIYDITTLQTYYHQKFNFTYQSATFNYTSPLTNKSPRDHQADPFFQEERTFIVDAIVAFINQRSSADRQKPILLGGKDQTLVNETFAIIHSLGLKVSLEKNVKITLDQQALDQKTKGYILSKSIPLLKEQVTSPTPKLPSQAR